MFKRKLHIHSDNSYWAGCENMVGIFLQDSTINDNFDVTFSFRYTKEYVDGMLKWIDVRKYSIKQIEKKFYLIELPITKIYRLVNKYSKLFMALGYALQRVETTKLMRLLKTIGPNIVHVNNGGYPGATSCNSMAVVAKKLKIPCTYMVNSTTRNPWWIRHITNSIRDNTTFISASNCLRKNSQFLWKSENLSFKNWEIISNTIIPKEVIPASIVRSDIGVRNSDMFFLCVGDLVERKGFEYAINAFNFVRSDKSRVLIISGEGKEKEYLEKKASDSSSYVKIINYKDVYSLINACDVLVIPSIRDEDFPNVMLIAMLYGKDIMASRVGGISECVYFKHTPYNTTFRSGFVREMVDIMQWFLSNEYDSWRNSRGNVFVSKLFFKNYGQQIIMNKYLDLWSNL